MEDNNRITKVIEDIKFSLEETITRLEDIWSNIGLREDLKDERCKTINSHIQDLLTEMLTEEEALEAKLHVKINEYEKELEQLCLDLQEEEASVSKEDLKLAEREAKLRNDVDILNKKKYDRMKCLRRLRDDEMHLCETLGMPQVDINFVACPTQEQLRELEQHIVFLKLEKTKRTQTFEKLRHSITTSWSEMDIGPENDVEYEILNGNVKTISKEYLEALEALNAKLHENYVAMLEQIDIQRAKFDVLWSALKDKLDEFTDMNIVEPPVENNVHALKILNANIDQLNVMKKQHLKKFILAIQEQLASVWDKCFFGAEQRRNCLSYYEGEYTEESLEYHEKELASVKSHFETNKDLFKLVAKREALWEEKLQSEKEPVDNLLNTRGGALLKALTKKNRIAKQLPKIENELQNRIKVWELQNSKSFMFGDITYLEHVEEQRMRHELEEKLKKDQKQEAKKKELSQEMQFGSSATKTKRKCMTPTSSHPTPTKKLARMDSTLMKKSNKSLMSNSSNFVCRSPVASRVNKISKPKVISNVTLTKTEKVSTFKHSSLKQVSNENHLSRNKKTKVLDTKLATTWSKKKRLSRRSICKAGVLKEICTNAKSEYKSTSDEQFLSDDCDFNTESDTPFSSSSLTSPDSLDCAGISVIQCDNDVKITIHGN